MMTDWTGKETNQTGKGKGEIFCHQVLTGKQTERINKIDRNKQN